MHVRRQIPQMASSSNNAPVIQHTAVGRVVPQISKPSPPMKSRIVAQIILPKYQGE